MRPIIYLDNSATTRVRDEVLESMIPSNRNGGAMLRRPIESVGNRARRSIKRVSKSLTP